jgi:hypothetical protein
MNGKSEGGKDTKRAYDKAPMEGKLKPPKV